MNIIGTLLIVLLSLSCAEQSQKTTDKKTVAAESKVPEPGKNTPIDKSKEITKPAEKIVNEAEALVDEHTMQEKKSVAVTEEKNESAPEIKEEEIKKEEIVVEEVVEETATQEVLEESVADATVVDEVEEETPPKATLGLTHTSWNTQLQKYVDAKGNVNYAAFKANVGELNAYLGLLAQNPPQSAWGKNKKLAYYINLYNAATVKLIVDNYPTKSIKDIPRRWKKEWIKVGNGITSLNDIEHKVLRKMNEPRIHFAINCASFSCPKLLNIAFTETNMESLLERTTREFINDPTRNKFDTNKAQLSKIFSWYKGDFTDKGGLLDYINPYLKNPLPKGTKINYLDYDWSLNEGK